VPRRSPNVLFDRLRDRIYPGHSPQTSEIRRWFSPSLRCRFSLFPAHRERTTPTDGNRRVTLAHLDTPGNAGSLALRPSVKPVGFPRNPISSGAWCDSRVVGGPSNEATGASAFPLSQLPVSTLAELPKAGVDSPPVTGIITRVLAGARNRPSGHTSLLLSRNAAPQP
jgi:hypothetical protein